MAATPLPRSAPGRIDFDASARIQAGVIAIGIIAAFWTLFDFIPPGLGTLTYAWLHDADWSHGPIIPLFAAYLVYTRWPEIRRCPVRHNWIGLVLLIVALVAYQGVLWSIIPFAYVRFVALLLAVLGAAIYLCGLPMLRYAWLPWLYLFFAIPLPKRTYWQLTNPLRQLAAMVAASVMGLFPGLEIERIGSNLEYVYRGARGAIGVADACSGMRSTVTLCALGVAVTFLQERPWWQRIVMIASCVPIATFCNFIRVSVTCYLHIFVDPKYAAGTYHTMLGLAVLLLAFGIFAGLGSVLNRLVVDDSDADDPDAAPATGGGRA